MGSSMRRWTLTTGVAASLATALAACGSARAPAAAEHSSATPSGSSQHAAAVRIVESVLAAAPLPPHSHEVGHLIAGLADPFSTVASPHLVDRTRWLAAPGTVDDVLAYLRQHRPHGMTGGATGSSGGGSGPSIDGLEFDGRGELALQYTVTGYHGGVAVRIDATTVWVPQRPAWSYIGSATSVDVTIVRKDPQLHQGAPTVRRTLTGRALSTLVLAVNRAGLEPAYGPHSCPAELVGEVWQDTLTFSSGARSWTVLQNLVGCSFVRVSSGGRSVLLDAYLDHLILRTLGLPVQYGDR